MGNTTPSAPDTGSPPAPADKTGASASASSSSCSCKRPNFRWLQSDTGATRMACQFCGKPPLASLSKPDKSKVFLSQICTNPECGSVNLRFREGSLVCVDCGTVMVESPTPAKTKLACPKCKRDTGNLRRRRTGEIYCQTCNMNADQIPVETHPSTDPEVAACPHCGAPERAIAERGDGRLHCTGCDTIITHAVTRQRPTFVASRGSDLSECPNCKAPARAIGVDGSGRLHCTSCDFKITNEGDADIVQVQGDGCPGCGAPPQSIMPDGNGRPHCTACDLVVAEAAP